MTGGFRHQALFYVDDAGFLDGTLRFIREGLVAEEPILVAVNQAKIARIKRRLGGAADRVRFLDMAAFGRNPARIIPVWRDFVAEHARSPVMRGIGEPVWPGRSEAELGECDRHESLLNLAFADDEGGGEFNLLCPYDARALGPDVLAAARRNHPEIINGNDCEPSPDYLAPADAPDPFAGALPRPPANADRLRFGAAELSNVRRLTWSRAAAAGFGAVRQGDLVIAINELASNSVEHGGGGGSLAIWSDPGALVFEVEDSGRIHDALVGRSRPLADQHSGRGLWLVNQYCDLVQIRSGPWGSLVRARAEIS